jgi:hypothetical protein
MMLVVYNHQCGANNSCGAKPPKQPMIHQFVRKPTLQMQFGNHTCKMAVSPFNPNASMPPASFAT